MPSGGNIYKSKVTHAYNQPSMFIQAYSRTITHTHTQTYLVTHTFRNQQHIPPSTRPSMHTLALAALEALGGLVDDSHRDGRVVQYVVGYTTQNHAFYRAKTPRAHYYIPSFFRLCHRDHHLSRLA